MNSQEKKGSKWDKLIDSAGFLGGIFIAVVALLITYDVFLRYFFRSPTSWVLEVTIYLTETAAFLSFAYALKEKAHVKVDFITAHLSGRTALTLEVCTSLLAILYGVVLIEEGIKVVVISFQRGEVSPTLLSVPQFIPKFLVPLGSTLLTFQFVRFVRELFRNLSSLKYNQDGGQQQKLASKETIFPQIVVSGSWILGLFLSLFLLKVNLYLGMLLLFFILLLSGIPVAFALGLFGLFGFYVILGGGPDAYTSADACLFYSGQFRHGGITGIYLN